MKHLNIITGFAAAMLSAAAGATTIGGIELAALANSVSGSTGLYYNYYSTDANDPITYAQLVTDLTDDSVATSAFSLAENPRDYIEMGFTGSNAIYNGAGADMALFFAGDFFDSTITNVFSIQINGITRSYVPELTPELWVITAGSYKYNLTYAAIDFADFGLGLSSDALANFKVYLGNATRPSLSMAAGFYTQPMVSNVPLPLPALLFASGLGVLGVFSRKRKLS